MLILKSNFVLYLFSLCFSYAAILFANKSLNYMVKFNDALSEALIRLRLQSRPPLCTVAFFVSKQGGDYGDIVCGIQ